MNRLLKLGCTVLALGTGPLLLYVLFGPRDGNPIGLGLLFFFSFPAALVCLALGGMQHLLAKRGRGADAAGTGGAGRPGPTQGRSAGASRGRNIPGQADDAGHWYP